MISTFFAKKNGMTGKYTQNGDRVGVTVLSVPQTSVKDLRTVEKDGYAAIRLEIVDLKNKKTIREVRTTEVVDPGTELKIDELVKVGDKVNVSGISKGKGFAGVVKRHGFAGGPRTHGQSDRERAPGSSGSTTTPGRVYRGTKRSGGMGNAKIMMKKMKVLEVNSEDRTVVVIGSVPGFSRRGMLLTVSKV